METKLSTKLPALTDEFVDDFLFKNGLTLNDYFIYKTPNSESICFKEGNGQKFHLSIGNDELFKAAFARLIALGVTIEVL